MNRSFWGAVVLGIVLLTPQVTYAIPPPDVIANIGSQFAQIFSLAMVFLSAGMGFVLQYYRLALQKMKGRGLYVGLAAISVVIFSLVITYTAVSLVQEFSQRRFERQVEAALEAGIQTHDVLSGDAVHGDEAFFEAQRELPIAISNEEFEVLRQSDIFVLDAREDEEYALGHYPESEHVRFADLLAGSWANLPTDEVVYVLCWSGIRGQALAEFLREKGIVARYLEDGASGWVEAGGVWEGEILFSTTYSDERYTGTLSTQFVRTSVEDGVVLVDARQENAFAQSHIPGSMNISIFFTPTYELEKLLDQVPPESRVITICDDYVSCFDAKIAGVKLEKRGHTFLGRYTTPNAY